MAIVADKVRRLDVHIDRIVGLEPGSTADAEHDQQATGLLTAVSEPPSPRADELLRIARTLSTASRSGTFLAPSRIKQLLEDSGLAAETELAEQQGEVGVESQYEQDIEWLLVAKATVQTYGILMNTFFDQIMPLSDDIWYWDDVLSSYPKSCLYATQIAPARAWSRAKEVYDVACERIRNIHLQQQSEGVEAADSGESLREGVSQKWSQFYCIVRQSMADTSVSNLRRKILSPVDLCRAEARRKRAELQKLRETIAAGLGILVDEGLAFDQSAEEDKGLESRLMVADSTLADSIALMHAILTNSAESNEPLSVFEDCVFADARDVRGAFSTADSSKPKASSVAERLVQILDHSLLQHKAAVAKHASKNGRPSRIVRYWLPALALLVSSPTILYVLVKRRDSIIDWIQNLGVTVRDFWFNWVIDPIRKVIGTIRHDANSEIAIMSRDSLKADRESLERMVVEFTLDNPSVAVGSPNVTDLQIADIRAKVREGDVTPILKAYEKGLRRPFVGAVSGDLVRSLLIQVQKTKVDLEVAISGIDSLLKSQELLFGFVGLAPGVVVSIGIVQYLRTVFGSRKGLRRGEKVRRVVRVLRKMDRILAAGATNPKGELNYKDRGLLLCEAHVLRELATEVLPGDVKREFLEDLEDLTSVKNVVLQEKALQRIRWAYAEWLRKK
ncbi:ATP synthase regulation protein NCA2-domain-containing protein [Pseudoneurospora amorphoporcata]|uniref:ATP synthase regulation protein NCA2-domain-containing protein n=1 Tax=Pseudoneurospora amorphoporcata TaxID=241081 RepID=A0AAN6NUD3_9PEZI|nr:ATP synthase regulation protein NCA2-domain-containing protein [Pseudoneurospora amorphoporcata]